MSNENNISKINISSSRSNIIETPKSNKYSNNNISKIKDDKSNNISLSYSNILPYSYKKNNKINNNEKKEVLLTSIFTLPKINSSDSFNEISYSPKKKNIINHIKNSMFISYEKSNKTRNNNNLVINEYNSIQNEPNISSHKKKKNDQQSLSILNSLKNKFYYDIEQQIKNHKQILAKDEELNQKLICIKKISTFWNSLCNYMNPIFNIEKFQLKKKNLEKENNILHSKDKSNSQNIDNFSPKKNFKLPKIYTNSMLSNLRYNKKKLEERKFKEKSLLKEFEFY